MVWITLAFVVYLFEFVEDIKLGYYVSTFLLEKIADEK